MVRHYAFTMIELIFAIVVIGITVVSLPMMIQVNQKGVEGNVKQEAIFATSAKMMQVLSFAWDRNSTDTNGTLNYAKVIDIATGANNYDRNDTSIFRVGHIQQGLHRRFFDQSETIVTNPNTSIEGHAGIAYLDAVDKDGYKYKMRLSTVVSYINDTVSNPFNFTTNNTPPSNIKLITITTTIDGNGDGDYSDGDNIDTQIVLRSYATNIGEIDYNKRTY